MAGGDRPVSVPWGCVMVTGALSNSVDHFSS
jgi:hypothetical protein